jgi:hypothetical protein
MSGSQLARQLVTDYPSKSRGIAVLCTLKTALGQSEANVDAAPRAAPKRLRGGGRYDLESMRGDDDAAVTALPR